MISFLFLAILNLAGESQKFSLLETITPAQWAVPEAATREDLGAYILSSATRVERDKIHHYLLVRTLDERGRASLQSLELGDNLIHLEGRVIDPAGQMTTIQKETDVVRLLNFKRGKEKHHRVVLVPQSLSSNCLLEVSWTEKAEHGLPLHQMVKVVPVAESIYCKEKIFEVESIAISQFKASLISDDVAELATRLVWTPIAKPASLEVTEHNGYSRLRYSDVPGQQTVPFGNPYDDPNGAMIYLFRTTRFIGVPTKRFWNDFGQVFVRQIYGEVFHKDGAYGTFLRRVTTAVTHRDVEGAKKIFEMFRASLTRSDMMTQAERVAHHSIEQDPLGSSDLLNLLFEKGYANSYSMGLAFYHVMVDCGFHPLLIFGPQYPQYSFKPDALNPFMLDFLHPVIGIKDDKGVLYTFAAAESDQDSGYLPDRFRRTPLFVLNPLSGWNASFVTLERPSWKLNRLFQNYSMKISETGAVKFLVSESRQGSYSAELRAGMAALEPYEHEELWQSLWQDRLPEWRVSDPKVEHMLDTRSKIKLQIGGLRQLRLAGASWLELDPFPGSQPLVELPNVWPHRLRTQPIVLPENRGQANRCSLSLPPGWRLINQPNWEHANALGKVSYKVTHEGDDWVIERQMILERSTFDAGDEGLLREYISWIDEAMQQRIAIRPGGGV